MRIAFIGDIVGTSGRLALTQQLPRLRQQHKADLVVANAENIANGSGITPEQYKKLITAGVDGLTLGDHAFRKQQIHATLQAAENMIRPLNLPGKAWGRGVMRLNPPAHYQGPVPPGGVVVCTVLGRLFMNTLQGDDPFAAVDRLLESLRGSGAIVIVEVHAEATSEKVALGWHLNGRVAAVLGSHTHVPTADARILPLPASDASLPTHQFLLPAAQGLGSGVSGGGVSGGTAYVTDLGMTGPQDSVLGRRADRVVSHMTTGLPAAFDVAEGNPVVQGVLLEVDPGTGLCTHIERLSLPADTRKPPFTAG